ncbi:hypothetical protein ACQEXU_07070 [Vibrio sp. TRT 21S02]|uniref:hypothetical protein n=1 Tax=Vibrio sp. TRT 21S02 TaxID=3418507 RepID=UPI003CF0A110
MNDAYIELQHIWFEIQARRWQSIERFLFPYYAYTHQQTTKNNKPCWETMKRNAPLSTKCAARDSGRLVPLIPNDCIVGRIKSQSKQGLLETKDALKQLLDSLQGYVVIREEEFRQLKNAGLLNAMPKEWYLGTMQSNIARLDAVGIQLDEKKPL